jgi:hypothetical protein
VDVLQPSTYLKYGTFLPSHIIVKHLMLKTTDSTLAVYLKFILLKTGLEIMIVIIPTAHNVEFVDQLLTIFFLKYIYSYLFSCQAISNPSNDEMQDVAWKAVMPLVGQLKKFYEYATELGKRLQQV